MGLVTSVNWPIVPPLENPLPRFARVRQHFPDDSIVDIPTAVSRALSRSGLLSDVSGKRVAITAGSRGIDAIAPVIRASVQTLRQAGAEPFVVAAMGSHGGATPDGQMALLAELGVTEGSVGCPLSVQMEADHVGDTPDGVPVFCGRDALGAGAILVVNRIKPHSILVGDLGSGLMKMLAVGLSKHRGADAVHRAGLQEHVQAVARTALDRLPICAGLALVENSHDRLARIEAVAPPEFPATDRRLLDLARSYFPNVPFDPLDVLIVRRIGKEISGAGMDPNVVGMHRRIGGPPQRQIRRIVALELSPASRGNAIGVGMADIITERLRSQCDPVTTYVNALTSDFLWGVKMPLAAPTDRDAIDLAFRPFAAGTVRAVLVRDTAHLEDLWVSEGIVQEAGRTPDLELQGDAEPLAFDSEGRLLTGAESR